MRLSLIHILGFISNRTKRTVDKALSARNTLVIIDICFAVFVRRNGIHATGPVSYTHLDVYKRQESSLIIFVAVIVVTWVVREAPL